MKNGRPENAPAKPARTEPAQKEMKHVAVRASKTYRIIVPKDEKLLDESFEKIPDTPLARKAKAYVCLQNALTEIKSDANEAGKDLVEAFDEAGKKQMKVQVGRTIYQLDRHSVAAKEEIKIKK